MSVEFRDRIVIEDLLVRCIIGIYPEERKNKQDVLFNIVLEGDFRKACGSDDIADAVDYKAVKKAIMAMAEPSEFQLVERLAQRAAEICLADTNVDRVTVRVEKPGAVRFARSVGVEIRRDRTDMGERVAQ